jgi:hypothetical protein
MQHSPRGPHRTRAALSFVAVLAVQLWLIGSAGDAFATTSRLPSQIVQRTLAMPESTLRFDAGHRWPYYDGQFKHVAIRRADDVQFLNPGLSFGLAQDFELGFVAPIRVSPNSGFEDPRVHLLYQFQRDRVDLGVFASLRLGVLDAWVLTGGVPLYFHWQENLRLDTGGFIVTSFGEGSSVSLVAPVQFVFQLTPELFAGPESGLNLSNLQTDRFDVGIPLGGFIGYTLTPGGTLGDLYARLRLVDIEQGTDVVELMLGAELYFDM